LEQVVIPASSGETARCPKASLFVHSGRVVIAKRVESGPKWMGFGRRESTRRLLSLGRSTICQRTPVSALDSCASAMESPKGRQARLSRNQIGVASLSRFCLTSPATESRVQLTRQPLLARGLFALRSRPLGTAFRRSGGCGLWSADIANLETSNCVWTYEKDNTIRSSPRGRALCQLGECYGARLVAPGQQSADSRLQRARTELRQRVFHRSGLGRTGGGPGGEQWRGRAVGCDGLDEHTVHPGGDRCGRETTELDVGHRL